MTPVEWFDALISEPQAYERFGHLLSDKELRRARQAGKISYVEGARGFYYHPDDLAAYLSAKRHVIVKGEAEPSTTIEVQEEVFRRRRARPPPPLSPEDETRVAEILARKLMNKSVRTPRKQRDPST